MPAKRKAPAKRNMGAWKARFLKLWRENHDLEFALDRVKKHPWDVRQAMYDDPEFSEQFAAVQWFNTLRADEMLREYGMNRLKLTRDHAKFLHCYLTAQHPAYTPRKVEKVFQQIESKTKAEIKQDVTTTQAPVLEAPDPKRLADDLKAQFRLLEGKGA